jgi:hypothetical protein
MRDDIRDAYPFRHRPLPAHVTPLPESADQVPHAVSLNASFAHMATDKLSCYVKTNGVIVPA